MKTNSNESDKMKKDEINVTYVFIAYIELIILSLMATSALFLATYFTCSMYQIVDTGYTHTCHISIVNEWAVVYPTIAVVVAASVQLFLFSIKNEAVSFYVQLIAHMQAVLQFLISIIYGLLFSQITSFKSLYNDRASARVSLKNENITFISNDFEVLDLFVTGVGSVEYNARGNNVIYHGHASDVRFGQRMIAGSVAGYMAIMILVHTYVLYTTAKEKRLRQIIFGYTTLSLLTIFIGPGLDTITQTVYQGCDTVQNVLRCAMVLTAMFVNCVVSTFLESVHMKLYVWLIFNILFFIANVIFLVLFPLWPDADGYKSYIASFIVMVIMFVLKSIDFAYLRHHKQQDRQNFLHDEVMENSHEPLLNENHSVANQGDSSVMANAIFQRKIDEGLRLLFRDNTTKRYKKI